MLSRPTSSQGESGNNTNTSSPIAPADQLANIPLSVALLITVEIPTLIFNLPITYWMIPPVAIDNSKQEITIASYLTPKDKGALSQTDKTFYSLYKGEFEIQRNYLNTLFKIQNDKPYNRDDLHKLLSHVALGELKQAEKIWSKDPSLLTRYGTVYHPNRIYQEGKAPIDISNWQNPGRYKYVNCTAWQIALMNEEYEEAEKMGQFMTEEEKRRQFTEIFPTGNIEKYNKQFEIAKPLLEAAIDAIINDSTIHEYNYEQMNEKTRAALQNLYNFVKPLPEHKIGLVFDVNIYVEALKLYEDRFDDIKLSDEWHQRSFWCVRIEEYLAALLSTAYLRRHAEGIGNKEKLERDGCKLSDGSSYFSFRRSSDSLSSFHFFVGYYGGRAAKRAQAWRMGLSYF